MINANDTRKTAESNKSHIEELNHIKNHFEALVRRATNKGEFTIGKQPFGKDRIKPEVMTDLKEEFVKNGYKFSVTENNALQQINIEISW